MTYAIILVAIVILGSVISLGLVLAWVGFTLALLVREKHSKQWRRG